MVDLDSSVVIHYARDLEHDRLLTWGRLEGLRTNALLRRFVPAPPAVVYDVGGATGAYAFPLARRGYEVHLLDAFAGHIDRAIEESRDSDAPLASAAVGDARALPFRDASADVVLLLGPLYHLISREDRIRALREAHRVLRADGLLMAAAISRFSSNALALRTGLIANPAFEAVVSAALNDGVHRNPDPNGHPEWFSLAYFHLPDELAAEVAGSGFADVRMIAVEGPVAFDQNPDQLDDDDAREAILRAIERVESEPSMLGATDHMIAVARKPATDVG